MIDQTTQITAIVTATAAVIASLAAVYGVHIARKGLTNWREQSRWQKSTELSEEPLVLLRRRRDAISVIRNPFLSYSPVEVGDDGEKLSDRRYSEYLGMANTYQKRFDQLEEVRSETYGKRLYADVIWGEDLSEKLQELYAHEQKLRLVVKRHLEATNPRLSKDRRDAASRRADSFEIMYENEENDPYLEEYQRLYSPIEAYLKAKLGPHK